MATLTIDTYRFIERLQTSGMPAEQAKALVEELQEVDLEHVATKEDLLQLTVEMHKMKNQILLANLTLFVALLAAFVGMFQFVT